MPVSPTTLYGTLVAPKWGCTDESALGILITSDSKKASADEATLKNGQGSIVHAAYHGKAGDKTVQFKVQNTGYPTSDLVGGVVVLNDVELGGSYIIKEVSNEKSNGDFLGGSMTLRFFDGFSYTTTTSTTTTTSH